MIGVTQIPLGIAGPLTLKTEGLLAQAEGRQQAEYYVPLATTEGALVASINRGCKALTQSGGVTVVVSRVGVTRGPVFETSGLEESMKLKAWIESHTPQLSALAKAVSSHLNLTSLVVSPLGRRVYVLCFFDTGDAMGMNMVTIGATAIAKFIESETHTVCRAVAGNFDADKKPAFIHSLLGRGRKVWAEVFISDEILKQTLKTSKEDLSSVWLSKNMLGSAMAGSSALNAHAANVMTALYAATGQDVAHVGEASSAAITTLDTSEEGVRMSVYLPDVLVGTVGGGTGLATQKEALSILGLVGGKDGENADMLAGIVGASVLAGEVSLLSSLAEGTLAESHEKLARGK
jgi:hydroxymethylglutaryl-CoA reductase (NADPH)